jgi:hypothetical protein
MLSARVLWNLFFFLLGFGLGVSARNLRFSATRNALATASARSFGLRPLLRLASFLRARVQGWHWFLFLSPGVLTGKVSNGLSTPHFEQINVIVSVPEMFPSRCKILKKIAREIK